MLGLDREVGLGHRGPVGLRPHLEVAGAEAGQRDRVGRVGELERQNEVGAHRAPTITVDVALRVR